MDRDAFFKIVEKSNKPAALEGSIAYLTEHLQHFLRKRERVLICFLEHEEGNLSWLMEQAVLRCDAVPVLWGPEKTWKNLLRQAFTGKVTAIIGLPLVVLGLTKLKKHNSTPLYIRRVITAGYPCPQWMIDGIVKGLDCEMGGCFSLGESSVVAGFACGRSWGVHLREAEYGVDIVDEQGRTVPPGTSGEMVIYPKDQPELRYAMKEKGILETKTCRCGSTTPRLLEMHTDETGNADITELGQYLQSWTSILDCRIRRGACGLEIEIVCFQGEKLPKLPSAAKLVVRPWKPETDKPFTYPPILKNSEKEAENH